LYLKEQLLERFADPSATTIVKTLVSSNACNRLQWLLHLPWGLLCKKLRRCSARVRLRLPSNARTNARLIATTELETVLIVVLDVLASTTTMWEVCLEPLEPVVEVLLGLSTGQRTRVTTLL